MNIGRKNYLVVETYFDIHASSPERQKHAFFFHACEANIRVKLYIAFSPNTTRLPAHIIQYF